MATIEFLTPTTTLFTAPGLTVKSTHATERSAQVYAARQALHAAGWETSGPGSSEGFRRPLKLPHEKMMSFLDASRTDERAQGFTATRGDDVLRVDASAGLPTLVLLSKGRTQDARALVTKYLS